MLVLTRSKPAGSSYPWIELLAGDKHSPLDGGPGGEMDKRYISSSSKQRVLLGEEHERGGYILLGSPVPS